MDIMRDKKKKSSKFGYLITFMYRFKIWSYFSSLIQMRESSYKDRGDVRERKWTMKPPFKKKKKKKGKRERWVVSNSMDPKI